MTKGWEREFAVERMREDPDVSFRSFARVLGVSHATIARWREEAGIPPRLANGQGGGGASGRLRVLTMPSPSASWSRAPSPTKR